MSLLQKSKENRDAINVLKSNSLTAPIVHCAYYSSLQLLKHYAHEYSGKSFEEIESESKDKSSHNFILNLFVGEIRKLDNRNAAEFYRYFSVFKRLRKEVDYDNAEILPEHAIEAEERADKISKFIKKIVENGECKNIRTI